MLPLRALNFFPLHMPIMVNVRQLAVLHKPLVITRLPETTLSL
jgi:hypothetical protein